MLALVPSSCALQLRLRYTEAFLELVQAQRVYIEFKQT